MIVLMALVWMHQQRKVVEARGDVVMRTKIVSIVITVDIIAAVVEVEAAREIVNDITAGKDMVLITIDHDKIVRHYLSSIYHSVFSASRDAISKSTELSFFHSCSYSS
jgi:hypothetical protein